MRALRFFLTLILFFSPALAVSSTVLARVGKRVITQRDLDVQFAIFLRQSSGGMQLSDEAKKRLLGLKKQYLQRMVQDAVVVQEAERRGLAPDAETVERRVQQSKEQLANEAAFQAALKSYGIPDEATYRRMLYDSMAYKNLVADIRKKLKISSPAIHIIYLLNPGRFSQPEQLCTSHILLPTRKEALEVIKLLDKGDDFARLAMERSQDKMTGARGGEVGCVHVGGLVPRYEAAAMSLKPGEYSKQPVHTKFGWHVILLKQIKPPQKVPYPQAWQAIHADIEALAIKKYIKRLVERAHPQIFPERLK